jgi:hypothetical protein
MLHVYGGLDNGVAACWARRLGTFEGEAGRQAAACGFLYAAWWLSRTGPGHLATTGGAEAGLLEPAGPAPPRVHDWRGREEADTARPREDETVSERASGGWTRCGQAAGD